MRVIDGSYYDKYTLGRNSCARTSRGDKPDRESDPFPRPYAETQADTTIEVSRASMAARCPEWSRF